MVKFNIKFGNDGEFETMSGNVLITKAKEIYKKKIENDKFYKFKFDKKDLNNICGTILYLEDNGFVIKK